MGNSFDIYRSMDDWLGEGLPRWYGTEDDERYISACGTRRHPLRARWSRLYGRHGSLSYVLDYRSLLVAQSMMRKCRTCRIRPGAVLQSPLAIQSKNL